MVVGDLQVIAPGELYLHLKVVESIASLIGDGSHAPLFRKPFPHPPFQTLTHHVASILNLCKLLHGETSSSKSACRATHHAAFLANRQPFIVFRAVEDRNPEGE